MLQREGKILEKEEAIKYLEKMMNDQERLEKLNQTVRETDQRLKQAEKSLEAYQIRISEEAAQLVRKKREKLEIRLEKNVQNALKKVEQAERKRTAEKNRQVKDHVLYSTREDKMCIKELRKEIRQDLRTAGAPFFCQFRLWFALSMPFSITDYLTLILIWMVFCIGIPGGIFFLIPNRGMWMFYGMILLAVLLSLIFYVQASVKIVKQYREVLNLCNEKRREIRRRKKNVHKTEKNISRGTDEREYDLDKQDVHLEQMRKELQDAREAQTRELREFEEKTRLQIIESFKIQSRAKQEKLTETINQLSREKNLSMEMASELHLNLVEQYEDRIGMHNMNIGSVRKIYKLLTEGDAETLEEAVQMAETV